MSSPAKLHLKPPFRAEHIGSFLRPAALYEKRELFLKKKCTVEELQKAEDDAIKEIVRLQQETGIKTITDGELRRSIFYDGVFNNLEGIKEVPNVPIEKFKSYIPHVVPMIASGVKEFPSFFCDGKIKRTKGFYLDDFKYMKSLVPPEDVKFIKVTMGAPSWIHQRHGSDLTYDLSVYQNDDEFFDDLGAAYRAEIEELYELGCRHIQIDNPTFCYFCNPGMISGMEAAGVDHEALLDTYIRAMNVCTQDRPADMTLGVHMCRGNFKGKYFTEGSYARISVKLFNNLDVDVFYLEYDDERAGDFEPLKYLPPNKTAVLGLVTSKRPQLETVEQLRARVNQAVNAICQGNPGRSREAALNQLCISPQCGFASSWEGNPVTEEDERKKLALLVEAAKQIWGEL